MSLFETVTDLIAQADALRRRPYGVIEMAEGELVGVHLRPFPKFVSLWQVYAGQRRHERAEGDRCWLYYNQPRQFSNFLALKYAATECGTSLRTALGALAVLDEIARIKQSDAILCDAANWRLSDRLLIRQGWQPHKPARWHRHFIKRFYGEYPPRSAFAASRKLQPVE